MNAERRVTVGRIGRPHGVHGECRVLSYTRPSENLCGYREWQLEDGGQGLPVRVLAIRPHGAGYVARLEGYEDRDEVGVLTGKRISVSRERLPPPEDGEFYWADLEGLEVRSRGQVLGRVDHLLETGANDVLVVQGERERLVPFVPGQYVLNVDLEAGVIEVDWDPDF